MAVECLFTETANRTRPNWSVCFYSNSFRLFTLKMRDPRLGPQPGVGIVSRRFPASSLVRYLFLFSMFLFLFLFVLELHILTENHVKIFGDFQVSTLSLPSEALMLFL